MARISKRRPDLIEAFQLTRESRLSDSDWPNWLHKAWHTPCATVGSLYPSKESPEDKRLMLGTIDGPQLVYLGDWLIRDAKGEIYSCKPEVFKALYEEVTGWTPE